MTVYVDSARNQLGRMLMSHMTADTLEELNDMADLIGLKRCWLQAQKHPHYDLCQEKRELAIHYGAVVVSSKEIVRVARNLRGAERRAEGKGGAERPLTTAGATEPCQKQILESK